MKDMTRWGRGYFQVGNALEIFRRNNVRFIAVNNGIDSEKPDTLEFAPFINIMSEWYAREYRAKNLERQPGYDRMKARVYRARKKAQCVQYILPIPWIILNMIKYILRSPLTPDNVF